MTTIVPPADYRAAYEGALLLPSFPGTYLLLRGRSPAKMLQGLAAGETPPALVPVESGMQRGKAPSSVILTPKGRMVTELRVARLENGEGGALLLYLPEFGAGEVLTHLSKFLPPRFAKATPPEVAVGSFLFLGPAAPGLLARVIADYRTSPESPGGEGGGVPDGALNDATDPALEVALSDAREAEEFSLPEPGPVGVRVVRSGAFLPLAFEVVAPMPVLDRLRTQLRSAGAVEGSDPTVREVLRLEKGRPLFGVEMDSDTLPPEAGIQERSIDHRKGCYTGQEVIVRIRDRGHVNRHLRGVLLSHAPPPEPGTPLFLPGKLEAVGEVRSAVVSPQFGQTIALAYIRREIAPASELEVGSPGGVRGELRELSDTGWVLVGRDSLLYS